MTENSSDKKTLGRKGMKQWQTLALSAVMCLSSVLAVAGEVRFNKGKLWLSKSTLRESPVAVSEATTENGESSAKTVHAASNRLAGQSDVRVFDLSVAMYRERTAIERETIGAIFTNFAYAVYEATDGKHKLGKVTVFGRRYSSKADIVWDEKGHPQASINSTRGSGRILMFDYMEDSGGWCVKKNERVGVESIRSGGFTLGHEWSHAQYGLFDEYAQESPYAKHDNPNDPQPHEDDKAVEPSIMSYQDKAAKGDSRWLNYSISANGKGSAYRDTIFNAQHRAYGKSAWE